MVLRLNALTAPRLWVIYACASALFFGTSVLGPFEYKIYNYNGLLYFAAVNLLFFCGLLLGPHIFLVKKQTIIHRTYYVNKGYKTLAQAASVIGVLSGCLLIARMMYQSGVIYTSASEFEEPKTLVDQILILLMRFGIIGYLFGRVFDQHDTKIERCIRIIGLLLPGAYYLQTGRRFVAAAVFFIMIIVNLGKKRSTSFLTKPLRHYLKWLLVIVAASCLLYLFVELMGIRNIVNPLKLYMYVPGDQIIKSGWGDLYSQGGSLISQLYNLADYMAQAPYYFALFWDKFLSGLGPQYYLSQLLRPVQTFLSLLGVNVIADASQFYLDLGGGGGRYAGFVWPMIVDFGVYLTPIVAFAFGLAFSKIDQYRNSSFICNALYPCVAVMCFFAPVYYFNIASMDWVVFQSLILISVLGALRASPSACSTQENNS